MHHRSLGTLGGAGHRDWKRHRRASKHPGGSQGCALHVLSLLVSRCDPSTDTRCLECRYSDSCSERRKSRLRTQSFWAEQIAVLSKRLL